MQRHQPINYKNIAVHCKMSDKMNPLGCCTTVGCNTYENGDSFNLSSQAALMHSSNISEICLNEWRLIIVTEGKGYYQLENGKLLPLEKHDVLLLEPNTRHKYFPDEKIGWKEYWIGFEGKIFDAFLEQTKIVTYLPKINYQSLSAIENILLDMINVMFYNKEGAQLLLTAEILHLLGALNHKISNRYLENPIEDRINEAKELIKGDFHGDYSPEEIAEKIGMNYAQFRRMFKGYTGTSPAQFQMEVRLAKAEELLTSTIIPITEIAKVLGFSDTAQFSSFFRKRKGMTARDFRNKNFFRPTF